MTFLLHLHDRPVEHDYTRNSWGHALHAIKIHTYRDKTAPFWKRWFRKPKFITALTCMGHGSVCAGDFIRVKMKSGPVARWEVLNIRYEYNPPDMFEIKLAVFEGYVEDQAATPT